MLQKNKNKPYKPKKSRLEVSDRPKNLLSVPHMFEILCDNNRLSIQLLLSSEICLFEVVDIKIQWNSYEIQRNPYEIPLLFQWEISGFLGFSSNFDGLNFKWTYLGAQEELDDQTVIVGK